MNREEHTTVRRFGLARVFQAIKWMDAYTLAAFNPAHPYRRPVNGR